MWRTKTRLKLAGQYYDANSVAWEPGQSKGLQLRPSSGDGFWETKNFDNIKVVVSASSPESDKSRYLYFNVDDAFAYELYGQTVSVSITYRDTGCSSFRLEYDNANPKMGSHEGTFRPAGNIPVGSTGKWKTVSFTLPQCRFMNRCNGTDFRFAILGGDMALAISKVQLVRSSAL